MDSDFQSSVNCSAETRNDHHATKACRNFRQLQTWQVRQYRTAVDENKWYMSENLGREVSWLVAERDFVENGYYDCAQKWRTEFCTQRCSFYTDCPLGQLLSELNLY